MLEDFAALHSAGRRPQLIIGPWTHTAPGLTGAGLREGIGWLRAGLLDDERPVRRASVRVYVTGERAGERWRDLPAWPPPGSAQRRLWLGEGRRLQERQPAEAALGGDRYKYDPADPTPSLGGPILLGRNPVVDNRPLEARDDVLTYTTAPLAESVEAIGPVEVELWIRATSPYFDMFARVCDIDSSDASWNVCDALARVVPDRYERHEDGAWRVAFDLWPMGHRFAGGHRIRLQVSSGAHPRYARNLGTGEDPNTTTRGRVVEIEVLHDARHPSSLVLPTIATPGRRAP